MPFADAGHSSGGPQVPTWDGHPKGWRRYAHEVGWYVQGTKHNQRRYLATRLIGRLTGAAGLLAMSWPQAEFDDDLGVLTYLRKLAQSPLVRRSLPNAAAIMSQYFQFRRNPGETITTFLVHEALGFEEFTEALARLREERQGPTIDKQLFGLETLLKKEQETEDSWENSYRRPWWHGWQDEGEDEWYGEARTTAEEESATGHAAPPAVPGETSPPGSELHLKMTWRQAERQAKGIQTEDETYDDSFILEVLRGWRLLQAASLTLEERRDVLSSSANRLDFESVSTAPQILCNEQLSGVRKSPPQHFPQIYPGQMWTEEQSWQ